MDTRVSVPTENFIALQLDLVQRIAHQHALQICPGNTHWFLERTKRLEAYFEALNERLVQSAPEGGWPSAATWLLDNYYLLRQTFQQMRSDLPPDYLRVLPKLETPDQDYEPRIYRLAQLLLRVVPHSLEIPALIRGIEQFQEVQALTMGEIWALPPIARMVVLEQMAHVASQQLEIPGLAKAAQQFESIQSESNGPPSIGQLFSSLRTLASENWHNFFERVSLVEAILCQDPTHTYPRMDRASRTRYLRKVEAMARASGKSEIEVATHVMELVDLSAQTDRNPTTLASFPGYYLLGAGVSILETSLGLKSNPFRRLHHWISQHPTFTYLGSIATLTGLLMGLLLALSLIGFQSNLLQLVLYALLSLIPMLSLAIEVVNHLIVGLLEPRLLPKLDLKDGIPDRFRTVVVIPALLSNLDDIRSLTDQLERHYLNNPDPNLTFALLTDFSDAPQKHMPEDGTLLKAAVAAIQDLNQRYQHAAGSVFHFYHRQRIWNQAEEAWMGWERKRGKLEEFNRLILGVGNTSYEVQLGNRERLMSCRYLVTVDADTIMPIGSVARLVGALAHPLNQARFDPESGELISGYTILQPRTQVQPSSANQSLFSQLFSGDQGLDLYTLAVSDVYQDLFAEGSYIGKGIYDVAAFHRCLDGRVPTNALLSHDLFEGLHGRVGLVTDIVLYEDYPGGYLAYMHRQHRWIRGDWQLVPWLFSRVPVSEGRSECTLLSTIDRWKILDNLRRSLLAPALCSLLIAAWFEPLGPSWFWIVIAALTPSVPMLSAWLSEFLKRLSSGPNVTSSAKSWRATWRWLLYLAFLPFEALVALDAIGTALYRMVVSKRFLLQWTTSARANLLFDTSNSARPNWSQMGPQALLAVILIPLILIANPTALLFAVPFLLVWLNAPLIASRLNTPALLPLQPLNSDQQVRLRILARQTWSYFEHFVGPGDNWLPPDHFQEDPLGRVAHRTSPTNIGLALVAYLGAYDLGYIGGQNLLERVRNSLRSTERLEKYHGHLLNWYDTSTLAPLKPRYVSTVDSGNLAAALWTLRQRLKELPHKPALRAQRWQGLLDTLHLLQATLREWASSESEIETHLLPILETAHTMLQGPEQPPKWLDALIDIQQSQLPALETQIMAWMDAPDFPSEADFLERLHLSLKQVRQFIFGFQRQIESSTPWLALLKQAPATCRQSDPESLVGSSGSELLQKLQEPVNLEDIPDLIRNSLKQLKTLRFNTIQAGLASADERQILDWARKLESALQRGSEDAQNALRRIQDLVERADHLVAKMDFRFLLDEDRQLLHIGYNLEAGHLDPNYYDLLASEARIASLVGIAKGDLELRHWLHLGRPLTLIDGRRALISWSGTMFEYLMPIIFTGQSQRSLLGQSNGAAIQRQIDYADELGLPWGISEAAYFRFDGQQNYQYRAFGVPGLGFKRGLANDRVIAPYASLLALPLRPQAVMTNLEALQKHGLQGIYGLYEAVDFTTARLPLGKGSAVVRSYFTHHQAMILLSIVNSLHTNAMVEPFYREPRLQRIENLLEEQVPDDVPILKPLQIQEVIPAQEQIRQRPIPWTIDDPLPSQLHGLSNGEMGVLISSTGAGYNFHHSTALTRWQSDADLPPMGNWLYLKDLDTGRLWSPTHFPLAIDECSRRVEFSPYSAQFICLDHETSVQMQICVAAENNVECRLIEIQNESERRRRLLLCSYAEVALAPRADFERHPAFRKLFIHSEYLADSHSLLFHRRPRSQDENIAYMFHRMIGEDLEPGMRSFESDRRQFLGRNRSVRNPKSLEGRRPVFSESTGATLDPIMSLSQEIVLEPRQRKVLGWVTGIAPSRKQSIALSDQFSSISRIKQTFDRSLEWTEADMHRAGRSSPGIHNDQRLLSLVFSPQANQRAAEETLMANRLGQANLWPYSISGDYPLLLVRVKEPQHIELAREAIKAHRTWRQRGFLFDLALLDQSAGSYDEGLQGRLQHVLTHLQSDAWLNQRAGIFLLRQDQMPAEDRILLETYAGLILDGGRGSLAAQVEARPKAVTPLPALPTTSSELIGGSAPALERPDDLQFANGLGGFSADGREYVIHLLPHQSTPAPWINVVANPEFGFISSETGFGPTWAINSGENRLSPWHNDPVSNEPSEVLYLRDEETGRVWTPTAAPSPDEGPYQIHYGAGYSLYRHNSQGLSQSVDLFVPPDAPLKVVRIEIENHYKRVRRMTLTYYIEWVLGTQREREAHFLQPEFDSETQALLVRNPNNAEFGARVAFLAANMKIHGLTTDRKEFLGARANLAQPEALERIGLSGRIEVGGDPCAVLQVHLDLQPGEKKSLAFFVGQAENQDASLALIKDFQTPGRVEQAWQDVLEFWDGILNTVQVQTPKPAFDLLINRWVLYQALACRIWGRSALYQSSGAFGFRDQLQDVMALLHARPEWAREHILESARHQFQAGDVLHWWHPPSGRGVRTRIADDLLWLPFVSAHYVRVSGDESILDEKVPFLHGAPLEPDEEERYHHYETSSEMGTLFEHALRAIEKGSTAGRHGLPLFGSGDWNDGMNAVGDQGFGESVWLGWFLYATLTAYIPLCQQRGQDKLAQRLQLQAERLQKALEAHAWDGDWYLRGYYDDRTPLGSGQNIECRIDSIAQSWAVLSQAGDPDRVQRALNAVEQHLLQEQNRLLLLFTPPFDRSPHHPGYIKGYPPGIRENGGQYTHAAIWLVWSLAELGRGNQAVKLFNLLNPILHSDQESNMRKYRVEPYVMAADVYSQEPQRGRGGWTWYTGSGAWMYRLGLEAILGFQRRGDKLRIEPSIPEAWPGFSLRYRYKTSRYAIQVENPDRLQSGVAQIWLDDRRLEGVELPLEDDGQEHHVRIRMGQSKD